MRITPTLGQSLRGYTLRSTETPWASTASDPEGVSSEADQTEPCVHKNTHRCEVLRPERHKPSLSPCNRSLRSGFLFASRLGTERNCYKWTHTPCVCFPFLLDHRCLGNAIKSGEWAGWELGRRQGSCCMNLLPWLRPCETLVQSREDIGTHFSFNPISGLRSSFCNTALELQALHRCKHNSRGCPAL